MKIMLAGKKGTGKDAAAAFLKKQYGGEIISFAEPLYKIMYFSQDILNIPRHKDRKFLTTMGDHFRATDSDIFVKHCMDEAYAIDKAKVNVFISDGRYENELTAGLVDGCYIIELRSTEENRKLRRPNEDPETESHSSENGYREDFPFNAMINNDGSLEDLYKNLEEIVASIIEKESHVIH